MNSQKQYRFYLLNIYLIMSKDYKKERRATQINTEFKLNLNNRDLRNVPIQKLYPGIRKLYLSHNKIEDLNNIGLFEDLEQFSIMFNKIISWSEFNKIKNKRKLRLLAVKGNPLEQQPNYMYYLINIFPELVKLDETTITDKLRKESKEIQSFLKQRLTNWVVKMKLFNEFVENETKCYKEDAQVNQKTAHEINQYIEETKFKLQNEMKQLIANEKSHFIQKNQIIYQLVKHSEFINLKNPDLLFEAEFTYFSKLLKEITNHDKTFMSYYLNKIQIEESMEQQLLKYDPDVVAKKIYFELKKTYCNEKEYNTIETEVSQRVVSKYEQFPYFYMDSCFVNAVYNVFYDIIQENYNAILRYKNNVMYKQKKMAKNLKFFTENLDSKSQRLKTVSTQSICSPRSIQTKLEGQRRFVEPCQKDIKMKRYSHYDAKLQSHSEKILKVKRREVPLVLTIAILNIINTYKLKMSFKRIKQVHRIDPQKVFRFGQLILQKINENKVYGIQRMSSYNHTCKLIENFFRSNILKSKVFEFMKNQLKKTKKRIKLLRKFVTKKSALEHILLNFAFKKWKLTNSKTLRYIRSIKNLETGQHKPKKTINIQSEYKKVIAMNGIMRKNSSLKQIAKPKNFFKN